MLTLLISLAAYACAQNQTLAPTPMPTATPTIAPQLPLPNSISGSGNYTALFAPCDAPVRTVKIEVDPTRNVSVTTLNGDLTEFHTALFMGLIPVPRPSTFLITVSTQQVRYTVVGEFQKMSLWCGSEAVYTTLGGTHADVHCPGQAQTIMQTQVAMGWSLGEGLGILFLATWVMFIVYYFYVFCKKARRPHAPLLESELPGYSDAGNCPDTPPEL